MLKTTSGLEQSHDSIEVFNWLIHLPIERHLWIQMNNTATVEQHVDVATVLKAQTAGLRSVLGQISSKNVFSNQSLSRFISLSY